MHGHSMHLHTFLLCCVERAFIDLQLVKYHCYGTKKKQVWVTKYNVPMIKGEANKC